MNNSLINKKYIRRGAALVLAASMTLGNTALAAEASGPELPNGYDEAYYATLDYYGGLTEGSIVKSYRIRDGEKIVDYGTYDEVNNLTDGLEPDINRDEVVFSFGEQKPKTFYFEGKTSAPYEELPWKISLSYRFNGVPVKAEEMAGKCGMAQIDLDIVPNDRASEYSRHNFTLMASTAFNDDDILSLSAPGAQIQLVGNLRTVIFMALPGEEQHFSIQVGSEDFSFPGMVMMMMPVTLSQLEQIAELKESKDEIQDSYDALNESFDVILNSLEGMGGNLESAARGLDELEQARKIISENTDDLYAKIDDLIVDMDVVQESIGDLRSHLSTADGAVTEVNGSLSRLYVAVSKMQATLEQCIKTLQQLEAMLGGASGADAGSLMSDLSENLDQLQRDSTSLRSIAGEIEERELPETSGIMEDEEIQTALETTRQVYDEYLQNGGEESNVNQFGAFLTDALTETGHPESEARETAEEMSLMYAADAAAEEMDIQNDRLDRLVSGEELSGEVTGAVALADAVDEFCADTRQMLDAGRAGDPSLTIAAAQAQITKQIMQSSNELLEEVKGLLLTTGKYQEDVHDAFEDGKKAAKRLKAMTKDLKGFLILSESVVQDAQPYLDGGTQKTLSGLAQSLRQAVTALDQTDVIRNAKNTVTDLIDEKWDEHTGEIDTLLLADPNAAKESLTDTRNGEPDSIQIIMRTQEIKVSEEEKEESVQQEAQESTFGGRIAAMFRDLWEMITGIFKKG